ncbi:hypothetical protein HIM_08177 [Hirsutella minnesotensis 3608]|uniref:MI domain-containing protein n=1 Tax=Hirsutella minnesotensis 3608 TaxID=1043627 RepID=A0A0F8A3T2_9HYPO|nr:hypothetical protein HIM_08177 [Hirsutella minnesotensis 3608]
MPAASVAELQQKIFKRMGLDAPKPTQDTKSGRKAKSVVRNSRKDQRKDQRAQKKVQIYSRPKTSSQHARKFTGNDTTSSQTGVKNQPRKQQRNAVALEHEDGSESLDEDADGQEVSDSPLDEDDAMAEIGDESSADELSDSATEPKRDVGLSRTLQERLAQDDAEVEEFERKLGIKKSRKSLPKAFQEDGLDELLRELNEGPSDSEDEAKKRKRDFDDWLSLKRRKTAGNPEWESGKSGDQGEYDDDNDDVRETDDDDESVADHDTSDKGQQGQSDDDEGEFAGFDSEDEPDMPAAKRQRENPYVAPTTGVVVAKYVPPSRRAGSSSGDDEKDRLRKQIQGQVNRLTDSNILSIIQAVDLIYQQSARGDVTEVLTDVIMAQTIRPESLPDQFFVLTGGFCAAVYKLVGSSFGSHLVRRVVKEFGDEYEKACGDSGNSAFLQKETSNLMTLLTQLYVFEVVGCQIIFDYMERLLDNLSEVNVELLVRVCRMAGRLLRKDDPQALKHVSGALSKAVSKVGYTNVSARTKFMVEIINDLKHSKPKAKGLDSAVVSEHVVRMKKRLGELKSQSRRLDGLAPMGMGLSDIEGADKHGKWWLVGASVPSYREAPERAKNLAKTNRRVGDEVSDEEDMDFVLPDYPNKARAQGFNTTAQIAIFTALMSANSHEQGYQQYVMLKLKKDDQLEIVRVLVQCVGSEPQYNDYYAMVGKLACTNSKVRFAFQDRLWKLFRGLGESLFGEGADDDETADSERMKDQRRASHVARMYASLVADGALTICILKPLELPELNQQTSAFVEHFLVGLLRECRRKGSTEDISVEKAFSPARDLPSLAAGLHWFLRGKVRKTKLVGAKEGKKLARVREKAQAIVQTVAAQGP